MPNDPATLTDPSGQVVAFDLPPQSLAYSHTADWSRLPVLGTAQPLLKYRHSDSSLNLPRLLFWSTGNLEDLSPKLAQLSQWSQPDADSLEPATLAFQWGQVSHPRVVIASLALEVTQWRSGLPVSATGSMSLLLYPVPPATQMADTTGTLLSERERAEYRLRVEGAIRASADLRRRLGLPDNPDLSGLAVDDKGQVTLAGKSLGSLRAILGSLPDTLSGIK